MSVDALFPMQAALWPFFKNDTYPVRTNPAWAQGRNIEREALDLVEPLLHVMALAGWRATSVHYTYYDGNVNFANAQWANIDLATRLCTLADYADGGQGWAGDAKLAVSFEKHRNPDGDSHAFTDVDDFSVASVGPGAYQRLVSSISHTGTLQMLWHTDAAPGRSTPSWGTSDAEKATWSAFWEDRRAEMGAIVLEMCDTVMTALDAEIVAVEQDADAAGTSLDSMDLPGLVWLYDPSTWAAQSNFRFRDDLFVNAVYHQAERLWHRFADTGSVRNLVLIERAVRSEDETIWQIFVDNAPAADRPALRDKPANCSLEAFMDLLVIEARSYSDIAAKGEALGMTVLAPSDQLDADSPFQGLPQNIAYFDLLCAMVQTDRIFPPDLDTLGLTGNFVEPDDDDAPEEGPIVAMYGTMSDDRFNGEQYIALFVFGEYALRLLQPIHPRAAHLTPNIARQAAWEYKGQQKDGSHVIALTLGRGVQMQSANTSMTLKYDVFRANSMDDFRRPLPRAAHLDPVPVPQGDLAFYDPDTQNDAENNVSLIPDMVDDLSATGAQALDHSILRQPRLYQVEVPTTLTNNPLPVPGIENKLFNFDVNSPPVFVERTLECGAMRFEWYRDGMAGDAPQVTYGITIRRNVEADPDPNAPVNTTNMKATDPNTTSKDASMGVCWSLDHAFLLHRPISEDLLASHVANAVKDTFAELLSQKTLGVTDWLGQGTWLDGGNTSQGVIDFFKPHAVSFFRLWYSGDDVRIDIDRIGDSDESFRPEIVKVEDVMDLPEQGFRLPARAITMGDYSDIGAPATDVVHTGGFKDVWCYDAMLRPGDTDVPRWHASNMPDTLKHPGGGYHADKVSPVAVLESYKQLLIAGWVSGIATYSDTRHFIIHPNKWEEWQETFGENGWSEEENRVPGYLNTSQTTDSMIATILFDVLVGFIPYVGTSVDVAEFLYAYETGEDKWGEPVATWQLALMGIAASIPFVSGSAFKGLSEGLEATIKQGENVKSLLVNSYPASLAGWAMQGMTPGTTVFTKPWKPATRTVDDAIDLQETSIIVADRMSELSYADKLNPQDVIKLIADSSFQVISNAGRAAGHIVATSLDAVDLSFILTLSNGAVLQVRVPALQRAFKARNAALPAGSKLDWPTFISQLRTSNGPLRAVADTFQLITYVGIRVNSGVPKGGGVWTLMGDLMLNAGVLKEPAEMLIELRRANIVSTIRGRLSATAALAEENAEALTYLDKYGDQITGFLKDLDATGKLDRLIGSKKFDDTYVIVGLARVLEYFDKSLLDAGSAVRTADLFPASGLIEGATMTADEAARHKTLLETIADFGGMALRQVRFAHAYELELDAGVTLSKLVVAGELEVAMQATYGGLKGSDGTVFKATGFAILEAKSLARAVQQIGFEGVQPNLLQGMKSLLRMVENMRRTTTTGPLDNGIVPAFSRNVFGRKFFFLADWIHLHRNGQTEAAALFDYAGREIKVPADMIPPHVYVEIEIYELGVHSGDFVYFYDLGKWSRAAQLFDVDMTEVIFKHVMDLQADDIVQALLALQSPAKLQALIDTGEAIGRRMSANLAAFINTRTKWPGLKPHDKKMPADYFLGTFTDADGNSITAAQEFFRIIGEDAGWLDVFKIDPTDATEALDFLVKLLSRKELAELVSSSFDALPRKAVE